MALPLGPCCTLISGKLYSILCIIVTVKFSENECERETEIRTPPASTFLQRGPPSTCRMACRHSFWKRTKDIECSDWQHARSSVRYSECRNRRSAVASRRSQWGSGKLLLDPTVGSHRRVLAVYLDPGVLLCREVCVQSRCTGVPVYARV